MKKENSSPFGRSPEGGSPEGRQKGNIYIWVLVVAIIILAAVVWWYVYQKPALGPAVESQPAAGPAAEPFSGGDTTTDIQNDLNAVDSSADLEKEMNQQLDADINNL